MNKRIKLMIAVGLAVLLLAALMATSAFAQGTMPYGQQGRQGWGGMIGGYGQGMMGGWRSYQPTAPITGRAQYGGYGQDYGHGMMGGWGYGQSNTQNGQAPYGGYGRGMMGGAMMGGWRSR